MDILIKISGSAGDGVQSIGDILTNGAALSGIHVFNFRSYGAEIRARGDSDATVRMAESPITSLPNEIDVLLSVNSKASINWAPHVKKGGIVIYDNRPKTMLKSRESIAAHTSPDIRLCGMPLTSLSQELTGTDRAKNVAAMGGLVGILKLDRDKYKHALSTFWKKKGESFVQKNLTVFEAGCDFARSHFPTVWDGSFRKVGKQAFRVFSGNEATALGALDAGCRVFAGYPITPASPILEIMARELPRHQGNIIQTEDEMAAIGVVLGASFTGVRAMTATSGPGFSLMVEMLGLSSMAEVPCVVVCVQRGGPSTGLPTKTEQSDLRLAISSGHGDSPRIVLAPTDVKECHTCMIRAFKYAQRYQMPVIVLTDFFLANRRESVQRRFKKPVSLDAIVKPNEKQLKSYKRFKVTRNGISPMAIPGMDGGFFTTTGLEHDVWGTPTYTPENHAEQTEKRFRKWETARREIHDVQIIGHEDAPIGLLSWGSTMGAVIESVRMADHAGINTKAFKTNVLWPLPRNAIIKFFDTVQKVIIPELNFQGQLADLLYFVDSDKMVRLNKVGGEPISWQEIFQQVKKVDHVLREKS
jgi:2-oxoglutarate ferredoxin oxidoreductase subunit alpha